MRLSALTIAGLLVFAVPAEAVSLKQQSPVIPGGIDAVLAGPDGPLIRSRDGRHFLLSDDGETLRQAIPPATPPPPTGALPDGVVTQGNGAIREVWLTHPTRRYDHGILGDAIEAGGLAARLANGAVRRLRLSPEAVFEDRQPRLADLDGDGSDEILIVKTYLQRGGALAVVAVTETGLEIVAEADPIGLTHRWLNPVGVADFDGDGKPEAAVVLTPHIGGVLQLYEWKGARLIEDHAEHGFSNHGIGMRELGMSAVADVNRDGVADIIVPGDSRRKLIGVTFAGGKSRRLFEQRHARPIVSAVVAIATKSGNRFVYGLADDTLIVLDVRP